MKVILGQTCIFKVQPRRPTIPQAAPKAGLGQQVEGGNSAPLL